MKYNLQITQDDIRILQTIGRKSINEFTSDEIRIAEKWTNKFWNELGIKSPFFRAWFGDWRAYDNKNKIEVINMQTEKKFKAGKIQNIDTKRIISWGDQVKG